MVDWDEVNVKSELKVAEFMQFMHPTLTRPAPGNQNCLPS